MWITKYTLFYKKKKFDVHALVVFYVLHVYISCILFYFSNSFSKNPFIRRSFLALLKLWQLRPEQSILLKHRGSNQNQGYYFVTFIKVFLGKKSLSKGDKDGSSK